ncbi:MAG: MerR family transcriptional regulator [Halodesulfovibrio sp.]|uniref:MerR family transcriptional regulator n=1 Tax=Halodesulfovibrio sp. TaxID=1912772 RepID=UPI00359E4F2D
MNIKDFSKATSLSPHTIRYYEKIGLLKNIERNASGHRIFSKNNLLWMEFITRLKETGMPLKQILIYAELRDQGEHTATSRMQLLQQHAQALEERLTQEALHLTKLKEKIAYYDTLITSKKLDLE